MEVAKEELIPVLEPAIRLAMAQQVLHKATEWKGEAMLCGQPFGMSGCQALEMTKSVLLATSKLHAMSWPATDCCPCCNALLLHLCGPLRRFWPLIPGVACLPAADHSLLLLYRCFTLLLGSKAAAIGHLTQPC